MINEMVNSSEVMFGDWKVKNSVTYKLLEMFRYYLRLNIIYDWTKIL